MFIVLLFASPAVCGDIFKPVVIYQGDIDKSSYNFTIHSGVKNFSALTGVSVKEIVVDMEMKNYIEVLDDVCRNGYSPVVLIYADHLKNLRGFVQKYSGIRFLAFGTILDEPNIFSLDLAEHEGSFLAGALAAMTSKSQVIAFLSISDIPLMRRFGCGYEQGAKYINPDIKVLYGFVGRYPGAWFDGPAASKVADRMMDEGADVVYQAAGGAGVAVLEAVAKRGKLGIGVDHNQNGLFPGFVLSSMYKRIDRVIYAALVHAKKGIWRDNIKYFGVAQDAVGLSFDEHNSSLVTNATRERLEELRSKIVLGEIKVHDFVLDNKCSQ
ncbi:MAG: BMP family ABC transporter substrate-binding protein [Halodesulfovibrio sp.]